MPNYLIIDLEVNTLKMHGRQANYFYNDIVAIGMKTKDELYAQYIYPEKLKVLDLDGIDVIVGHNISFDLMFLWGLDSLQSFFKRGGKVFCTQLAEYILTGQQAQYAALRDIAVNKYGCKEREKVMEVYWGNTGNWFSEGKILVGMEEEFQYWLSRNEDRGFRDNWRAREYYENSRSIKWITTPRQTSDIPKELVLQDVKADVLDTEQVFLKQYEDCRQRGLLPLIELQNDALLATTEMSYNGMKIDLDILHRNKLELQQKLETKKAELLDLIKPLWGSNDRI